MDFTKIIELFIDDDFDESGIEAISLVSRPAHDETWLAFNADEEKVEEFNPYTIVNDDFCSHNPKLSQLGEPYGTLEQDGWEIVRVEKMTIQEIDKLSQQKFNNPNEESVLDRDNFRVRYKYAGPRDNDNRQFCADMLRLNRVYRIEDIDALSDEVANPEFGFYEIFKWRGSYNCRHQWVRLIYKKTGKIDKSARVSRNRIGEETLSPTLQPDTRNKATIDAANRGETKAGIPTDQTQWDAGVPRQGGSPLFNEQEKVIQKFQSYNDYPDSAKNNACKVLRWRDEHGDEVKGMTQIGWTRANQLCNGENISEETIARMSAFQRHKKNSDVATEFKDTPWKDAGYVAWLGWGGTSGVNWAASKLQSIRKMSEEDGHKQLMFMDDEKRIIVGAAMVPNKMIHRYDALGNKYFVFFSKKTIEKMAQKFLRQKRTDETSVEHDGRKLGAEKVWITESWVSEDPEKDKSAAYGFNLPTGTWFVSMKVEDDEVWKMIKEKSLTGFSVEGLFAEKSIFSKEDKQINQIKAILKSIKDE
jgi:hypothetical protein